MSLVSWVPLLSEFDVVQAEVLFRGKRLPPPEQPGRMETDQREQPAFGLALSSLALADGKLSADIEFENVTEDSVCELAIVYDANARHFVTAGLWGRPQAMSESESGVGKVPPAKDGGTIA